MTNEILICALSLSSPAAWKPPLTEGKETLKIVAIRKTEDCPSARDWLNEYRKKQAVEKKTIVNENVIHLVRKSA